MRIIVLGASGQIGSVIYAGLRSLHHVMGTSRKRSNELVCFDPFRDDWAKLGKADALINCVGRIKETGNFSFYRIHTELTKLIITNRAKIGTPRIVQISALGASSTHEVKFLKTKGMADDILLQHPNTAVVRPSIVCTHHTMIVKKMFMLADVSRFFFGVVPVPMGFLKTRIQPIMPLDLVDLVQHVCVSGDRKIVDAVGPEILSFREIIQILSESVKRSFKIIEVPRMVSDLVVKNILSRLCPGIINTQQYQLLFHDNVADAMPCRQFHGKKLTSTREFFEQEFRQLNE